MGSAALPSAADLNFGGDIDRLTSRDRRLASSEL